MYNADITKYSSIKLDYLFCIIGIIRLFIRLMKDIQEQNFKNNKMKKALILAFMLVAYKLSMAQKVYSVDYENQADVKVFVVKYQNQADLKVFRVKYQNQAGSNDGKWFFTKYSNQAKKSVYFVKYENQADLKIFFVEYESQAGWSNSSKKSLMY
jgi:hypothetical protein